MKAAVRKAVQECDVCQRNKAENVPSPGLLEPVQVPERVWEDISIDFIEGLSMSFGKSAIMVVVDRFSKFSCFIPPKHPYTAPLVAHVFHEEIFKLYGLPKSIVSDRDRIFTSEFWCELFRLQGTQLLLSTLCHAQMDGQTERISQCLEACLRCFCSTT